MNDYKPIACGDYDEIEILAMHRSEVEVLFRQPGQDENRLRGRVVDTSIHAGGEFLVLESAGARTEIRLDWITGITEKATGKRWRQKNDSQRKKYITS